VVNAFGAATSSIVTLSVVQGPPVIDVDVTPPFQQVPAGVQVTYLVVVSGTQPFHYQWFLNSTTPIPGSTNSSYTFAAPAGSNSYSVTITNQVGTNNSATAALIGVTNPAPVLTFSGNGAGWTPNGGRGIQFGTNGMTPDSPSPTAPYLPTAPVNLASGHAINVRLYYGQGVLHALLVDATAGATNSTSFNIGDLPAIVGAATAYVGFTGATGGENAIQTISNFRFSYTTPPCSPRHAVGRALSSRGRFRSPASSPCNRARPSLAPGQARARPR
jgi:hypothetical protein